MKEYLTVTMVSAELHPFAKVGGLADVAGALSATLAERGHQVLALLPRYRTIDPKLIAGFEPIFPIKVPMAGAVVEGRVWRGRVPGAGVVLYLIEQPELFDRDGIYTDPRSGAAYEDNARRFIFFCRAAVETLRGLGIKPDVVHAHDQQAALVLAYLKTLYSEDAQLRNVAGLLTIHNLGYQGIYDRQVLDSTGLPPDAFYPMSPFEFWGKFNCMKAGILFADLISTVSPRYAQEIQWSEEFGFGLEGVLRDRQGELIGILNGIDPKLWDPARDPALKAPYSRMDPGRKPENKLDLLGRLGLAAERQARPLVGMVSRLVDQKGIDLLREAAGGILERDLTLVVLGSGQEVHETFLRQLARQAPGQVAAIIGYDEMLAHRIYGGTDLLLVPSRYEPCGLSQLYALRYGAIPVVRAIGGLADTIEEFDPASGAGTGFVFTGYTADELLAALDRAVQAWSDPVQRGRLVRNGMSADHSWQRAAAHYVDAYRGAIERKRRLNHRSWATRKVGQR